MYTVSLIYLERGIYLENKLLSWSLSLSDAQSGLSRSLAELENGLPCFLIGNAPGRAANIVSTVHYVLLKTDKIIHCIILVVVINNKNNNNRGDSDVNIIVKLFLISGT